jgi:hypothetical protein
MSISLKLSLFNHKLKRNAKIYVLFVIRQLLMMKKSAPIFANMKNGAGEKICITFMRIVSSRMQSVMPISKPVLRLKRER